MNDDFTTLKGLRFMSVNEAVTDNSTKLRSLRGDETSKDRKPGSTVSLKIIRGVLSLLRSQGPFQLPYFAQVPYCVTDESALECQVMFKESIKRNIEAKSFHAHSLKFRSKKQLTQTLHIREQYCRDQLKFYPNFLHKKDVVSPQEKRKKEGSVYTPFHPEKKRRNNNWPNEKGLVECDSKLLYHRQTNQYSMLWVHYVPKPENQGLEGVSEPKICAIDPGVRTFATWYSPTEGCGKIGDKDASRIVRLGLHLDNLISRTSQVKAKKRNNLKKAQARSRQKIKNLVTELHKQTVHNLLSKFDVVIHPNFNGQTMASKKHRKIQSKTVRQMLTWSHATFRDRLLSKAEELGKKVMIVSEAYTSKTCGRCGVLNNKLGGAKVFKCTHCNLHIDRDVNGARNILLRALVDGPWV